MSKAMHAKPFRLTGPYTARHARPESPRSKLIRAVSLGLACVCLLLTATVYPASAATNNTSMASLQTKLDKLSQSINQHKKELSDAKKKESAAKALESELKERVTVLQDQISVLGGQIAAVQNSIGEKEQQIGVMQTQITDKQTQIEQKQNEIDAQWDDFKKHMAAMQELRDGGSVAMLGAVNDLYELLTFNEVMQDISIKDTEIMNNMKSAKQGLEDDKAALEEQKAGLEAEKAELQSQKSELDSQNAQMKGKQSELNNSISAAKLSAAEAQAAQQKAQAAIESDELNYEAGKKEIGRRHAYLRSRQRLCAGGWLVYRRLWQLRYHLPRQNVRWQYLFHPVRAYALGGYQCGQVCEAGRTDRLCGHHRQFHRQPPTSGGVEGRLQGQRREPPQLHPHPAQLTSNARSLVDL